ncbi:glycoside hydrolase family 2 TIM barrel-domain containing protein [Saccharicrinis fermentans]|uniref:glycoside hydrolase family 2 TIM barrel-domain containing protein n=1 Tax=Saccharicrinis fermentans TaxID=982 RepID=UPI0004851695|nr:glycoside hydrolase family 2 TIM barrel-domain containing protein [Saccharicrinis fermentans]
MKRMVQKYSIYSLLLGFVSLLFACQPSALHDFERETDFNFGWKFQLLNDTNSLKDVPLEDAGWRDVRLPHDWSIEASFDSTLEGCVGYLPGGVGVYQKHFTTTSAKNDKSTFVLFDGVYNNAKFWLNGKFLGENPYGYSPVFFNLTDALNEVGEPNVLTVYVDHSRFADSRWYTGSGIYRKVKLVTLDKLHIPIWGTFVTTPEITDNEAKLNIEITVENERTQAYSFSLRTVIFDASGKQIAQVEDKLNLGSDTAEVFKQQLELRHPQLWDPEHPYMYKAVSTIVVGGKKLDQYSTPFGIRSLRFDKDKGFFLNGKSTYVKGVCLHHDGGLVGAAVPKGVWQRRLKLLKEAGVNAIRTSHNPFSDEFLDLCDEMGFLVQNEIFDEMDNPKDKRFNLNEREVLYRTRGYTEHFQKWGESDLKRTMQRDRNHPSVFQWSIGNEIEWTYPDYKYISGLWDPEVKGGYWNKIPHLTPQEMKARYESLPKRKYNLAQTAHRLSKWVKDMDTTRPVTANLIIPVASCATGYADALDVVGFSYQIKQYDWCKKHYPNMLFTGSENSGYLSEWKSVVENPMVFSMYMWTGIDYLGESNLKWPQKAWSGDMLDLAGFKKAGWNHFKSIWTDEPFLAIQTHAEKDSEFTVDQEGKVVPKSKKALNWNNALSVDHWNYKDEETVIVEVVSNLPEAELFLNGQSLGSLRVSDSQDQIMRWAVPYQAGILEARAVSNGKEIITALKTAAELADISVDVDKTLLQADGYDVSHVVVQLVDKDGVPVKTQEQEVVFEMEGNGRLLGVDNGWNKSTQDYQTNRIVTHLGRCMAIIQSNTTSDIVRLTVRTKGVDAQQISIRIE